MIAEMNWDQASWVWSREERERQSCLGMGMEMGIEMGMGMGWESIKLVKIRRVGVLLFQRLKGKVSLSKWKIDLTNDYKNHKPRCPTFRNLLKPHYSTLPYAWCADMERIKYFNSTDQR